MFFWNQKEKTHTDFEFADSPPLRQTKTFTTNYNEY